MATGELEKTPGLLSAYEEYERERTIRNNWIGCILGIIFMPAGFALDRFVYEERLGEFFVLRMICSALLLAVWWGLGTGWGGRAYRLLGLIEVSLPLAFISEMIRRTEGFESPYYAGLNLVVFGAGLILRWKVRDILAMLGVMVALYLIACFSHGAREGWPEDGKATFNNLYFLLVTGVFIGTGLIVDANRRLREFALRFELDRSRDELRESNRELEENREQLEASNRRLVEMDQVKSRFFANISHELRTPLTLLLAPLESMLHKPEESFSERTREWLATMEANGLRLLKLINDLLDLVKLESGSVQIRPEPVRMTSFLRGVADSVRKVAEDKQVRLETRVGAGVEVALVDRDKLEKILLNLVFNAIKFTGAGGRVELSVERDAGQPETLTMRVTDTGMGIAAENLENLFRPFWQADTSSQRKYQGTGIGLAIVKELTEAQGGEVDVESALGEGTSMILRLPGAETEASDAANAGETDGASADVSPADAVDSPEWLTSLYRRAELFPSLISVRATVRQDEGLGARNRPAIVVADDEPDMLRFLRSQLADHFEVYEAVGGQQAIEKAAQYQPDIVLLDMMMPEKDGLEVCRELRERETTRLVPIVLLTARADEETKLAALAAGASDFLTKPFSTTELHVRLKNLVESQSYQRQLAREKKNLEATMEELRDAMELLKDTETQLVQSEKLASLGRMSAGIIHEINNPLNYAKTGIHMLKRAGGRLPEEEREEYEEILADIREGVERVIQIVSDLRTFTHSDADQLCEVEVAGVVGSALRFLAMEWQDSRVEIRKDLPEGMTVWCNSNRLTQILVNLLQNSLDALAAREFPEGGSAAIDIRGEIAGGRRWLIVRDNGNGIPEENVAKVFDPFFTTKDVGAGMGLGLSICYRIMEGFGGRIELDTVPGEFCEFRLAFPDQM